MKSQHKFVFKCYNDTQCNQIAMLKAMDDHDLMKMLCEANQLAAAISSILERSSKKNCPVAC